MIVKTLEQAREQLWKVLDWKDSGEIGLYYLVATVSPGPARTITGEIVNVAQGSCMWSGCSLFPRFSTESEAVEYAKNNGLRLVEKQAA